MNTVIVNDRGRRAGLTHTMHIVYGLHALGLAIGAFGAASVVRPRPRRAAAARRARTGLRPPPRPIQAQAIPAVLQGRRPAGRRPDRHRQDRRLHAADAAAPDGQPAAATPRGRIAIRALILTPTRELAAQVEESVRTYGKYTCR
jgi:hypothetical protein